MADSHESEEELDSMCTGHAKVEGTDVLAMDQCQICVFLVYNCEIPHDKGPLLRIHSYRQMSAKNQKQLQHMDIPLPK